MPVHTIGDSHCYSGWDRSIVTHHHVGPMLCYSFGQHRVDIRTFPFQHGDTLIFCFGEIDCRCHIQKYVNETTTYKQVIDPIIENYFRAIEENIQRSNLQFKHVCVYNVVPTIQKYNTVEDSRYPYLGTDEERRDIVLYFNQQIKEFCQKYNYVFFDVYDKYTDANGFFRKDLSDGQTHIRDGRFLSEFLEQLLLSK
jgi:hypothetical protein